MGAQGKHVGMVGGFLVRSYGRFAAQRLRPLEVASSHTPRLFVDYAALSAGKIIPLRDDQSRHLCRALRLRPGAKVVLFDGVYQANAVLLTDSRKGTAAVEVQCVQPAAAEACPRFFQPIGLAVPLLEQQERMRFMVEKGTELACDFFAWMRPQRAKAVLDADGASGAGRSGATPESTKFQLWASEAAAQCERSTVPKFYPGGYLLAEALGVLPSLSGDGSGIIVVCMERSHSLAAAE